MNEQDKIILEAQRAFERGDYPRCIIACDEALKNDPRSYQALHYAGLAYLKGDNEGLALQLFNNALKISGGRHEDYHNIGVCLHERQPVAAYKALIKAQDLTPDQPETLLTLCNVSSTLGRHAEAVSWAEKYFSLFGHSPQVAHNQSFALFAMGRWKEGWKAFRGSLGSADRVARNYTAGRETPRWSPAVHKGAVAALYGEQGIGDEILYAAMIADAIAAAAQNGSRIVIECDERNAGLFQRSFPEAKVYGTRAQTYCDWPAKEGVTHKMEFGGLGEHFAPEPFRRGGYLQADNARRAMWRAWFEASGHRRGDRAKVGLAWTGGSWATGRARRSLAWENARELIEAHPDVTFVCLEYEDRRDELGEVQNVLNPHWATRKGADYDDLAALVSELDLVIAPTTSVIDLCGALGVKCWAMADAHPQWRYSDFLGPDRMFFYDSVKVFRQEDWGDWSPMLERMSGDLKQWEGRRLVIS